jgi:tetratricopeptide (TPR) repeat protein
VKGGIATKTLAEVYLSQGDTRKALEIYQQILKRDPLNTEIQEAIKDLKHKMAQSSQGHAIDRSHDLTRPERIRILERWRENVQIIRKQRKGGEPLEQ